MVRGREIRIAIAVVLGAGDCGGGAAGWAHDDGDLVPIPIHADSAGPAVRSDSARARHRFQDADRLSRLWDDPERFGWQEPQRVVDLLRLHPGMRVADIGAGTGYFNPYLSRAVGPEGVVYAADVESTLVAHMQARAVKEETPNVHPVLAAPDDPRIPASRLDRVLLVDTYHHIDGRIGYFRRLRRLLDERSLVVVVDWLPGELPRGPAPEHKIAPEEVMEEMRAAGYTVVERSDLQYQYVLVFRPQP